MNLALFDLDNTLLNGDSDHGWGMYLAEIGVVDAHEQQLKQDMFYQQYLNGTLDIFEFCEYQFEVLHNNSMQQLLKWRADFVEQIIEPMIASGKTDLIEKHQAAGDELVIVTATNDFVTQPIADRLGIPTLIATRAELVDGAYTGKVCGIPCFKEGKIDRVKEWLLSTDQSFEHTTFYSDSYNDLPLMEYADTAIAVTPDDRLRAHAERLHWPVIA